jgi:hypothetical protein
MNETETWTDADRDAAAREGWDLFDSDGSVNGPLQLCKFDDPEEQAAVRGVPVERTWADDNEAWMFVWSTPSPLHTKALAVLEAENPQEVYAIEKWAREHGVTKAEEVA